MISRRRPALPLVLAALAVVGMGTAVAQMDGVRGVAPVDSSGSFEVSGVHVDVTAKSGEDARHGGWRLAQRKAWQILSQRLGRGGALSDGALDALVSGIIVEDEDIGPNRYIANLGVLFSRDRTGQLLGVQFGGARTPAMLVMPVQISGGTETVFERRTPWQEAWARFRTGNSTVDYVRPAGTGPDALLLNAGQLGRRSRGWWRTIIDQYGADDVVMPTVRLYPQWPGGPVIGVFEARHGPDDALIDRFTLKVNSADGLPQLLDEGIRRIDAAYQHAFAVGQLQTDATLSWSPQPVAVPTPTSTPTATPTSTDEVNAATPTISTVTVQFDTPTAASVSGTEATVRGLPGVQSAITTSLALGGTSVMRVTVDGTQDALRAALVARGYSVDSGPGTLRIRRAAPVQTPSLPADERTTG